MMAPDALRLPLIAFDPHREELMTTLGLSIECAKELQQALQSFDKEMQKLFFLVFHRDPGQRPKSMNDVVKSLKANCDIPKRSTIKPDTDYPNARALALRSLGSAIVDHVTNADDEQSDTKALANAVAAFDDALRLSKQNWDESDTIVPSEARNKEAVADALILKGCALVQQESWGPAEAALSEAITFSPRQHGKALYNLGIALQQQGKKQDASAAFQQAWSVEDSSPMTMTNAFNEAISDHDDADSPGAFLRNFVSKHGVCYPVAVELDCGFRRGLLLITTFCSLVSIGKTRDPSGLLQPISELCVDLTVTELENEQPTSSANVEIGADEAALWNQPGGRATDELLPVGVSLRYVQPRTTIIPVQQC